MSINIIVVHFPNMRVHFWPTCEKILDEQRRPTWSLFKSQILSFAEADWHEVPYACTWTPREQKYLEAFFLVARPFSSWPSKLKVVKLAPAFFLLTALFYSREKGITLTWISFFTFVESDFRINEFIKIVGSLLRGLFSPRYLPVQGIYLKYRK